MIVEKPNQCAQFILDSVSDPFLILTLKVSAIIKARIIPHSENKSSRDKSNIQTSSISQPLPTSDPKIMDEDISHFVNADVLEFIDR